MTNRAAQHWIKSLLSDSAGNTLALIAAALFPLLALLGGGIDMGRSYLSQSRLQQACDSGVLAARKKLGSAVVTDGIVPADVAETGARFFNMNFRDGAYGTTGRSFTMTLEKDYSISGEAHVDVPTTIMSLFGYDEVSIPVKCEARLNFANTDVMFVLDTTGSMADTNPGDSLPKIDALRNVVETFTAQLEGSKAPGTRIRYGFLPYSTNVNVGGLLNPDWVVDKWTYQLREQHDTGTTQQGSTENWTAVSGTETVGAVYNSSSCPADNWNWQTLRVWTDPNGAQNTEYLINGTTYSCIYADLGVVKVTPTVWSNRDLIYTLKQNGSTVPVYDWLYKPVAIDVSSLKHGNRLAGGTIAIPGAGGSPQHPSALITSYKGCIEERSTYEITNYSDVDLTRALDLDIDLVPNPANPDTQWRPVLHEASFERSLNWYGAGSFSLAPAYSQYDFLNAGWASYSACPAAAQKLQEMSAAQVTSYLSTLNPAGSTYHDIGMIWGGRMLSPTGLFAADNADLPGKPTSRNLIFLTDGLTAPLDISYGTYGVEPLDRRRWSPGSSLTLTETVEKRFEVACSEVKKRNITVWIIGFGTTLNPIMSECAGPGHTFEAANSAELNDVFTKIATQMGSLRISK